MYLKVLLNYILGYVNVEIEGFFIERLINLCTSKKIFLWNIKRKKTSIASVNVGVKDFRKLIKIAKETKCKAKINYKKGLPFILNKYKKRKLFFLCVFIVVICILSLSNFVWNIEIIGNNKISKEELIAEFKKEGLSVGKLKQKINTKDIINKIRLNRDDIAWLGIEITGTNAKVKVVEANKKPEIVNEEDFCNIVATKPGIIVKVNALNGTPLVKQGDTINKGSILIGGWLEGNYTGTRYVHANGQVQAKVWYSQKEKINLKQTKNEPTGRFENKYSVRINNFQINFYKTLSKFKNYDTIEETKKIKLFLDFYLPIEKIKITNSEYEEKLVEYSKEEAKQIGIEEAKRKLNKQIEDKDNILNTYINYNETKEAIEVEVIYELLEEIGSKEKIVF